MATRRTNELLLFPIILVFLYYTCPSNAKGTRYVTCSSVLKLLNVDHNVRLHSHDVKYGSGSGQQSVTGIDVKEGANSYWLIKAETGKTCTRGKPVKCGEVIRLEHTATKKNLHSHHVSSPLSGRQEVSAYGDSKGDGDTGDHWLVVCQSDFWERNEPVEFNHVDTDVFLSVSGRSYGSPVAGQLEVVGDYMGKTGATQWKAMEGFYVHPTDLKTQHYEHTEL